MSLRNFLDDVKSMGPFELVAFLIFLGFSLLLVLAATSEAGPLVSLVQWANAAQTNFNAKQFGSPRYYKKVTVFGFMFVAMIPYLAVRFIERSSRDEK